MSEHLEPLVAAYVAQRQRDFHRSTRGIPTPENRAVWEFDASEKIRAHDREVEAAVRESLADDLYDMAAVPHLNAEYRAGLGHAADLVRPVRRIESEARP